MSHSPLLERFLRYVTFDTQSDDSSLSCPSTPGQMVFARALADELRSIGAQDVSVDENGYVMATIPGNVSAPGVGFLAHMDTSPDCPGKDVHPRVINAYDGKDIPLGGEVVLSPEQFPLLSGYVGRTLVVADGTTLLGSDDKAGVAEIMTLAEFLLTHPEISHGPVRVGFTPDEEIGRSANLFDVERFGVPMAYTLDGGGLGELEFENFNAAGASITVNGLGIHPGSAKGKMKNAILIAMELQSMLPPAETPATTDGYDGFFHLDRISGDVEKAEMRYIIRDHDAALFAQKKERLQKIADYLNEKYGEETVQLTMTDSYYNMREKILERFEVIEIARAAMQDCGITPVTNPIRGGTDGARLSYMGLPCPNLFAGGHNSHGRYEFACLEVMQQSVDVMLRIVERFSELDA